MTTLGYLHALLQLCSQVLPSTREEPKNDANASLFLSFFMSFSQRMLFMCGGSSFEHDCSIFSLVYQREQLLTNQRLCSRHQAYYNTYYTKTSYTKISIPMLQIVKPKHSCNYLLEKADTQFYTPMQSSNQLMLLIQWYPIFSTCRALRVYFLTQVKVL